MKKKKIRKRTRIKESNVKKKSKSIHSKFQSNNPNPTFDKDKLFNYLRNEYAKIANNYLIKLYENIPDLENARRSINIDLDIPTLETPNDAERFILYNTFQDLQKMHEKIPEALDRIYKDEPKIRELFPDLLKNQKLAKQLYNDLKEDNLLETTMELQKNDKVRTHLWSTTIINMTNHLTFQPQKLIEYLDDNKLVISWPIMVYSYIRDFELFFRFIVDPSIGYDPLNLVQEKNYIQRFREFCQTSGKMRFYSDTLRDVLKTSVRNRLAHQQYYVKMSTQEIILFKDDNYPQGRGKVITFNEMLGLTISLNSLLWSTLLLIFEGRNFDIDENIQKMLSLPYSADYSSIMEQNLEELQSLPCFDISDLQKFLGEYINNLPPSNSVLPYPMIESYNHHLLLFKGIKPNQFELMDIQARSQYLVGYALLEEKYLKPIAKALKPRIHLGYVKDKELLNIVNDYRDSKYQELFEVFNPEVRNAIAHVEYYKKNDISYYFDTNSQTLKPLGIRFFSAFKIFSDLDDVFNIPKEQVALLFGIAKFLSNVYFDGINLNSVEYQTAGETILNLDSDKYEELYPFGVICVLIGAFLTNSRKTIRKWITQITPLIKDYNIDPSIIFGSVLLFAFKNNPKQSLLWLNNLIQCFSLQPHNDDGKRLLWFFKALLYLFNNEQKKARQAYLRGLRI